MDPATRVSEFRTNVGNGNTSCANHNTNTANIKNGDCNSTTITTTNITGDHNYIAIPAQQPNEEKHKILEWISPLDLQDRHQDVRERRFEGVGNWLLQGSEYSNWAYGSADPTLFCYGDPGVGKTYISSLVIDTLHREAGERNFRVFYVYCGYLTHKGRSATDLIAGLLKRVVAGLDRIPREVSQGFETSKSHGGDQIPPLLREVRDMLGAVLASFRRAFICIDALDEFPQAQRPKLLSSLAVLVQRSPETRLFLTGRPQIRHEIERGLGNGAQIISIKARGGDIERYIIHRLAEDGYPDEMDSRLRRDIREILPQRVSGIFLLVYLKMNAILDAASKHDRRKILLAGEDKTKLWGEYNKTLNRIAEQGDVRSQLALKVLMWLCYSKRPLHVDELRHALAVEEGSTSSNPEKVSSARTLSGCCLGLVTVDKGESTIHLIHSTVKDYLDENPERLQGANLTIAETCLTYLNFEDIKSLPLSLCTAPENTPFLQYASCYWGEHAREETKGHTKALVKKLLGLYNKHISAKLLLLEKSWPWGHDSKGLPDGFSGLHCAAFFGLQETANAFLDTEVPNSGRKDITGSTPLTWAARNGHKELVQLLLGRKDIFDPETKDNDGCTPFSWAARNGHKEVVELFLGEDAIGFEAKDYFGRTPLSWASGSGHQGMVELLLGRQEISPETKDYHGRTPLSWAAGGGHGCVVKLLLGAGEACPNSVDNEGRTSVSWAAGEGYEGVVDFFLREQGVNPNLPDYNGRTLLSMAAESGRWSVVKLLLGRIGIVPGMADNNGMTPLSWAASKGNEAVVKLFMEKGETGSDSLDKDISMSLWWAAGSGHAGVVRLLLGWKGVNPNFVGEYGWTSLMRAAMHGHEQVVKLLLESGYANHNLADHSLRTPLSWAAGNGHDKVVDLLLKSKNINTELADKDGRTPLSWAARSGNGAAAQLLLKEGNADPRSRDASGRTPISWAADEGHGKLVDLLLSQRDVDPNTADNIGRTPLSWAARSGRETVTKLLLSQSNIGPNIADSGGRTPLSWAAGNGSEVVTNLLLSQSNIEPNKVDRAGRTPLSWAAGNGWEAVANLLLKQSNIKPDMADGNGRTPLSWAAQNGCDEVVQLLIDHPDVNPNSTDGGNRTPLSRAAEEGCEETVSLLLGRSRANPDSTDCCGQTPLSWAARNGHEGTVQLLLERVEDPDLAASDGRTPLSWARENQHEGVVRLFQQHKLASTPPLPDPIPGPRPLTPIAQIQRVLSKLVVFP